MTLNHVTTRALANVVAFNKFYESHNVTFHTLTFIYDFIYFNTKYCLNRNVKH